MNSLTFYKSFYEAIKNLDEKARLKLYDAIFDYQFAQKNIEFDDVILQSFWTLIQPNIDASNSKKLAGAKGGRPKKNQKKASFLKNKNHPFQNSKSNVEEEVDVEVEEEVDVDVEKEKSETTTTAKNPVLNFYLGNINSTPVEREVEILESYQEELPDDLIIYAMEKAIEKKARNLGYIKAILNSWKNKGITTLEEAKEEKEKQSEGATFIDWNGFLERHKGDDES